MYRIRFICLLLLTVLAGSCRKSIPADDLQGIWLEQDGEHSTLVFSGDLFYLYHNQSVDTSTYTLDEKHAVLWTAPLDSSSGGHSYQLEWHKRKKILVVIGLFPSAFGNASKNYFKKQ